MSETPTQSASSSGPSSTSTESKSSSVDTKKADDNYSDSSEKSMEDTHRDAASLLSADIARNQARISAYATGLQEHHDALEEAESDYDEVRAGVDNDAVVAAYTALLNPVGLHSQSRQIDTSGLAGFGASSGVVHAADVFGSSLQRAVAAMAHQTPPDPVTVIGAVPHSDLVEPESLQRAQSGSKKNKDSDK